MCRRFAPLSFSGGRTFGAGKANVYFWLFPPLRELIAVMYEVLGFNEYCGNLNNFRKKYLSLAAGKVPQGTKGGGRE